MNGEKCGGKVVYQNYKKAKTEINKIKRTSHRSRIPKRVYYCRFCKGFHLTSLTSKKRPEL